MGYFLYAQGGSDHGFEDRIRGTCRLLPCRPTVVTPTPVSAFGSGIAVLADLTRRHCPSKEDFCLLSVPKPGPGRRILWSWSGSNLPAAAKRLDAVVVPNTGEYQRLRRAGLRNICLGPDPQFLVERKLRPLAGLFRKDTVGLCLSNEPMNHEAIPGLLYAAYVRLIADLLAHTDFDLVLIPYGNRHSASLLSALHRQFSPNGRIFLRPPGSSPVLRGDLSLCRFVIGSAGAAAAWSCGVSALCIGADPYAMGLAADLFGDWQDGVLPVAWVRQETDLSRAVFSFFRKEDALRRVMATTVPHRRQRAESWRWENLADPHLFPPPE